MNNLFVKHIVFGENILYNNKKKLTHIIHDGFLRPAKDTNISSMEGNPKFIYLKINLRKNEIESTFKLNVECLLQKEFWVNLGWEGGKITEDTLYVDARKLTLFELTNILLEIIVKIKLYIKTEINKIKLKPKSKRLSIRNMTDSINFHSHEILVKKPINLHKYLISINSDLDNEQKNYLQKNYSNVKIN